MLIQSKLIDNFLEYIDRNVSVPTREAFMAGIKVGEELIVSRNGFRPEYFHITEVETGSKIIDMPELREYYPPPRYCCVEPTYGPHYYSVEDETTVNRIIAAIQRYMDSCPKQSPTTSVDVTEIPLWTYVEKTEELARPKPAM